MIPISTMQIVETKMIFIFTQQYFLPDQIPKKDSTEKMEEFLEIPKMISKKNKQLINLSRRKQRIIKKFMINSLHKFGKNSCFIR